MLEDLIHKTKERLKTIEQPKLLLAVSGGVDSSLLWYLIDHCEVPYALAHVNFSLRGKESERDEQLIKDKAKKLKLDLHLKRVDAASEAQQMGLSIQESARKIRYAFFEELMEKKQFTHLLTAHHLDDSFETFLINLNRGTGLKGLTGINQSDKLWRPLLNCSKKEIRTMAEALDLSYREDASNAEVNYLRNFFRHEIIAKWESRNPQILETMQANMQRIQEYQELVDDYLDEKVNSLKEEVDQGYLSYNSIMQLKHPKLVMAELFKPYGFNFDQLADCLNLIQSKFLSGSKFISATHQLVLDREKLLLLDINKQTEKAVDYELTLSPQRLTEPFYLDLTILEQSPADLQEQNSYFLDFESLREPLILRKWQEGDRIQPLGMKGKKKVSDILIDAKVSLPEKQNVWLVESAGNICLVFGFGISESFKVKSASKKILKVAWRQ